MKVCSDCLQIAGMLRSGASDSALGDEIVPIVNARFLTGHKDIPRQVVQSARGVLNSPGDALKPFKYGKGADTISSSSKAPSLLLRCYSRSLMGWASLQSSTGYICMCLDWG